MKIIYLAAFNFTGKNAASKRVLNNLEVLKLISDDLKVIATVGIKKNYLLHLEAGDVEVISAQSENEDAKNIFAKIFQRAKQLTDVFRLIKKEKNVSHVVMYSGYSAFAVPLILLSRKMGFKIIFDAVEWYQPNKFLGIISPKIINSYIANNFLFFKFDGIIAISKYLEKHFKRSNIFNSPSVIRLPPLIADSKKIDVSIKGDIKKKIKLLYAGDIGPNKDRLENFFSALFKTLEVNKNFEFTLIGPNKRQLKKINSYHLLKKSYPNSIIEIADKLPLSEVQKRVTQSHFIIYFRNKNKVSLAGFPTKFVEALSLSTPVITNNVGDIGEYLIDGKNGYVCENTTKSILDKLLEISKIDQNKYSKLSHEAYTSSLVFNYRNYVKLFKDFFYKL